ncbi:response regulator transcription factor [Pararcticibacter amylolyticus]|uniref:DNA-binding response regulator n=1 Tax=Pararcticibacter amylolyticus TaxID=2173175 RepID=A0A2U2PBD4_9SPHI|nr:response regulator transcription factor [Pararcticibacter amylolyticus]PWG78707.1 DNA-binding response regulator [Pararcticibacter amylolyticus]
MDIRIGLADDQQLFLRSLSALISSFPGFSVSAEALNGEEMLLKLRDAEERPHIVLLDVSMPVMDGCMTAERIRISFPEVKTVALSMKQDDDSVLKMLRAGCCAYLLKDIDPHELKWALTQIYSSGYYNAGFIKVNLNRLLLHDQHKQPVITDREREFLKYASSDLTYKQIASKMFLSEKTVDGYREALFSKFNVKSRVGMVLEAVRRDLLRI